MFALVHANEKAPRVKVASSVGVNEGIATLASRVMGVLAATDQPVAPLPVDFVRRPIAHGFDSR